MRVRFGCCLVWALAACGAQASERADFTAGEGTNGWTISATEYVSPTYAGAVDRISLSYSGAPAGSATVNAIANGGGESLVATLSAAANAATFDFPETTDFRAFRISATGDWRLLSFAADVSATFMEAPSGLTVSNNTTGTSFDAYWNPVAGAAGYKIYVWTNATVGASAGTQVWVETMPGATNAASSTKLTDAKFNACFEQAGWTRSDKAGYPTGEDGMIRIGTSGDNGWIQTPSINYATDGMAVCFMAKANDTNTKSMDIAVERVSGENVYPAGTATLSTDMQEFVIPLPEWESGDCIRINSLANGDRRTTIGTVSVVSGCSAGREEADYIINGRDVGDVTSYSISDLPSVPVQVAVAAYGRRGVGSANSVAVPVDLSNPEKIPVLNAFPLSDLEDGIYVQNFDSLAAPTLTSGDKEWLNGTTLSYWQAYKQNNSVRTFKYNGGAGTVGGLYALATSQNSSERALGGYSTQTDEICFGIAFTNNTDVTMKLSSVSYSAQQWGFKNNTNQTLSVSAALTEDLVWISDYGSEWTEISSAQSNLYGSGTEHATPSILTVTPTDASALSIRPGQVLMLKWTIHSLRSGTPGMLAIDDLTVTFSRARSLVLHIF